MSALVVRTNQSFSAPGSAVWPLLCDSRMDSAPGLWFKFGIPRPRECRLPDGLGGVGSERECISDQGIVHQRILVWEPTQRLSFRMERTDLRFQHYVSEILDTFDLVPTPNGTLVTRTTQVQTKGRYQFLRRIALYLSLKQVHRYVFRNWRRLAERGTPSAVTAESRSPSAGGS
jgi:hypothetical protein